MSGESKIEWTDATWNPTTGCDRVSPGCDRCYAMTLAPRLKAMGSAHYQRDGDPKTSGPGFGVSVHSDALVWPLRKKKPLRIFVNSMSDLFHDEVPDDFIAQVFAVMALAPQHTFQLLTKRHGRMRSLLTNEGWHHRLRVAVHNALGERIEDYRSGKLSASWTWPLPNVWLGVSVENQQWADIRIPALLDTPAAVRFLSCEPLLGAVEIARYIDPERECNCHVPAMDGAGQHSAACRCFTQPEISWVIVGGESGPGARPMHPDWARSLRDQCTAAGVAFHFKQWGEWKPAGYQNGTHLLQTTGQVVTRKSGTMQNPYGHGSGAQDLVDRGHPGWVRIRRAGKKFAGRELDGRTWDEFPPESPLSSRRRADAGTPAPVPASPASTGAGTSTRASATAAGQGTPS